MHFIGEFYSPGLQIYNHHILYNHVQNVCLSSIPKKREENIDAHPCLDGFDLRIHQSASVSIRRAWMHVLLNKTLILRVVLLDVLTHRSVVGLVSVPKDCCLNLQGPITTSPSLETSGDHLISSLIHQMDLMLAMPYTHSLTDNRASLLTILMFSTGFWVCSCTVLYTVANTSVFPFLSEDVDPRVDATCVSAEADSVRKHTVALTKKKHCCTDRYIWRSLCVYSIHL